LHQIKCDQQFSGIHHVQVAQALFEYDFKTRKYVMQTFVDQFEAIGKSYCLKRRDS